MQTIITKFLSATTTTRHLNKWLQRFAGYEIKPVPQATIDQIHHRANLWEAQQAGVEVER